MLLQKLLAGLLFVHTDDIHGREGHDLNRKSRTRMELSLSKTEKEIWGVNNQQRGGKHSCFSVFGCSPERRDLMHKKSTKSQVG
jgi:hypothetical protein